LPRFVSRKREFRADELACYVAGAEPMAQGPWKIGAESLASSIYWYREVAPPGDGKLAAANW
jgi:Zn-dependent protease with chaperone function